MKQPTVGAAVTERWSERGSGLRHVIRRRQLQDDLLVRRANSFFGRTGTSHADGVRADQPIAGSAREWIGKPFAVIRGSGLWEPPRGDSEAKLFLGNEYFSGVSLCNRE